MQCACAGSDSDAHDQGGDGGRELGAAAELPPRRVLDVGHGEDL